MKLRYLNLAVILAFLIAQVQYACSSYFCTMMQAYVSGPSTTVNSITHSCEDLCNCPQRTAPHQGGGEIVEGNCIKTLNLEKSVISSFTDPAKFCGDVIAAQGFIPTHICTQRFTSQVSIKFTKSGSPPLDLPILNSNLRI